jgi:hypothetical protein
MLGNQKKKIYRKKSRKSLYHYSHNVADSNTTSIPFNQIANDKQDEIKSLENDQKHNQLKKRKEKSFWASWFSFGTSFSDSDDSDDEKNSKKKFDNNKINDNNSYNRPHGPMSTMSTRKSSACKYTNFNAPDLEAAKLLSRRTPARNVR